MGKRELLLIVGFVIVGAVVYQATAPPPGPNDRGFSLSHLIDAARREIRGNRASAELTTTSTEALTPEITELRLLGYLEAEVIGEDRADIATSLRIRSNAYDEAEAKRYAQESTLVVDRAGQSLSLRVKYPQGRQSGRQWGYLTVKVPSRLRVRTEGIGKSVISGVAAVEMTNSRSDATIKHIAGRVTFNHRGGSVSVEEVESLKFTGRGTELKVRGVRGDTSILFEQGGELNASGLSGAVDVESRNADVTLSGLEAARGPIRVNVNGGSMKLEGLKTDTRIDGRNAELEIAVSRAAPIAIYSDGDDVLLTPPATGYRLDAVVVDGQITPEALVTSLGLERGGATEPREVRASGAVGGGGPTITVRATRGDLTLREREK
jgi:hypothetical protein